MPTTNLYPITGPWADADLATAACPRGGDWLADEIRAWKDCNIAVVVSALTRDEIRYREVEQEGDICGLLGLEFIHFPIGDRESPLSGHEVYALVGTLMEHLENDRSVVVHCRAGIGRASLLAACTLVRAGVSADDAFARISLARGIAVPDTREQHEWVRSFAKQKWQDV